MKTVAIIGDIHGRADLLRAMLERSEIRGREVVTTGDMVNVGPESKMVLQLLLHHRVHARVRPLLGNHEVALIRFIDGGDFATFAFAGGIPTIKSYVGHAHGNVVAQFKSCIPPEHVEFLREAAAYYEDAELLISHCGVDPARPLARDLATMTSGGSQRLFDLEWDIGKIVVCGHYMRVVAGPFVSRKLVCVDTGAGVGGPLTAYILPEGQIIQEGP